MWVTKRPPFVPATTGRADLRPSRIEGPATPWPAEASLAEVEMRWIDLVLERCGGNRTQAARQLGIDPATLWRKLKKE
jgi:DNA-binding NtrC family response regulator